MIVVTKADGRNVTAASIAASQYQFAMRLLHEPDGAAGGGDVQLRWRAPGWTGSGR